AETNVPLQRKRSASSLETQAATEAIQANIDPPAPEKAHKKKKKDKSTSHSEDSKSKKGKKHKKKGSMASEDTPNPSASAGTEQPDKLPAAIPEQAQGEILQDLPVQQSDEPAGIPQPEPQQQFESINSCVGDSTMKEQDVDQADSPPHREQQIPETILEVEENNEKEVSSPLKAKVSDQQDESAGVDLEKSLSDSSIPTRSGGSSIPAMTSSTTKLSADIGISPEDFQQLHASNPGEALAKLLQTRGSTDSTASGSHAEDQAKHETLFD
ncbi:hypothetical protein A2U01_0018880, partial [Trifolium medium]|nr:hypothetical protein [Trifolium medium]